jgi:hypothetical protein
VVGKITPLNFLQTTGKIEVGPTNKCEGELDPLWDSENEMGTKSATETTDEQLTWASGTTEEMLG